MRRLTRMELEQIRNAPLRNLDEKDLGSLFDHIEALETDLGDWRRMATGIAAELKKAEHRLTILLKGAGA